MEFDSFVQDLATVASLAPSCMSATLALGNAAWARQSSLTVAVWSKTDLDCKTPDLLT